MTDDTITLIALADRPAWELATRAALPGQSWGHAAGLAADGYKPELAVVRAQGAKLILPFHRRDADGAVDIATLPGLSGAMVAGDTFAPLAAWSRFAARQGWVAGYIQLSPENDALQVPPPDVCKTSNVLYVFDSHDWSIETSIGHNMRRNLKAGDRIGAQLVTDVRPFELAKLRMLNGTCSCIARISFSGAMLGRPPRMSASYMAENFSSILPSVSFIQMRIGRRGWLAGTKSSSFTIVNRLSL